MGLHKSVFHKKEKESKPKKTEKLVVTKYGYPDKTGRFLIQFYPDGKSKSLKEYVKKIRQTYPELKKGDKVLSKELRKLFKHDKDIQPKIKGSKLEVKAIKMAKNGMTHYLLENKKYKIKWCEGSPFGPKSKIKNKHYITRPVIYEAGNFPKKDIYLPP